ncbi:MAG: Txe/YoeB family addiction module toxin [Spirochaetaceae bacterium]|nr:Txe/YoeB family addiction module toxin [Spirochaetaceae bacterium]
MSYKIVYTKDAVKDYEFIKQSQPVMLKNLKDIIQILRTDPYQIKHRFEKLHGHKNRFSRRLNNKHRIVYEVYKDENIVKIVAMWGHYDDN